MVELVNRNAFPFRQHLDCRNLSDACPNTTGCKPVYSRTGKRMVAEMGIRVEQFPVFWQP